MKKYKFVIIFCLSLILVFVSSLSFAIVYKNKIQNKWHEFGDFKCYYDSKQTKRLSLWYLSDEGKSKETIIVPKTINGMEVYSVGGKWESSNLKKVYTQTLVEIRYGTFSWCKNQIELYCLESINFSYLRRYKSNFALKNVPFVYVQKDVYNEVIEGFKKYYKENANEEVDFYYNLKPASVTYYYNYIQNQPTNYYWIDNIESGRKIDSLPQNPERYRFDFMGWYTEPECVNEWDFEVDTVPAGGVDLYAKWEIN